jgi:hypothetical protein
MQILKYLGCAPCPRRKQVPGKAQDALEHEVCTPVDESIVSDDVRSDDKHQSDAMETKHQNSTGSTPQKPVDQANSSVCDTSCVRSDVDREDGNTSCPDYTSLEVSAIEMEHADHAILEPVLEESVGTAVVSASIRDALENVIECDDVRVVESDSPELFDAVEDLVILPDGVSPGTAEPETPRGIVSVGEANLVVENHSILVAEEASHEVAGDRRVSPGVETTEEAPLSPVVGEGENKTDTEVMEPGKVVVPVSVEEHQVTEASTPKNQTPELFQIHSPPTAQPEQLIYMDEFGNAPEDFNADLNFFSKSNSTFGYTTARLLQYRFKGIVVPKQ